MKSYISYIQPYLSARSRNCYDSENFESKEKMTILSAQSRNCENRKLLSLLLYLRKAEILRSLD